MGQQRQIPEWRKLRFLIFIIFIHKIKRTKGKQMHLCNANLNYNTWSDFACISDEAGSVGTWHGGGHAEHKDVSDKPEETMSFR